MLQNPWDQKKFESLLAKWVAACDQPFSVVSEPEFVELLQYTHHPSATKLKIPGEKSVKRNIMQMSEDMIAQLKEHFMV